MALARRVAVGRHDACETCMSGATRALSGGPVERRPERASVDAMVDKPTRGAPATRVADHPTDLAVDGTCPSRVVGVGHEPETLPDVRRTEARRAEIK